MNNLPWPFVFNFRFTLESGVKFDGGFGYPCDLLNEIIRVFGFPKGPDSGPFWSSGLFDDGYHDLHDDDDIQVYSKGDTFETYKHNLLYTIGSVTWCCDKRAFTNGYSCDNCGYVDEISLYLYNLTQCLDDDGEFL